MSNVCDIQEIQFTKPFSGDNGHDKSKSPKGIEFILIGSDGVWDGGDYSDKNILGHNVVSYVAKELDSYIVQPQKEYKCDNE